MRVNQMIWRWETQLAWFNRQAGLPRLTAWMRWPWRVEDHELPWTP